MPLVGRDKMSVLRITGVTPPWGVPGADKVVQTAETPSRPSGLVVLHGLGDDVPDAFDVRQVVVGGIL
jgi:hypothetical protein